MSSESPDAVSAPASKGTSAEGGRGNFEDIKPLPPAEPGILRGILKAFGKTDVYTWMLGLSVIAIAIAVTCLAAELSRYDWDIKATKGQAAMTLISNRGD